MKWNNKGHQLDHIGERLTKYKGTIYIYGAGEYGEKLKNTLSFIESKIIFVDMDKEKQMKGFKNCKVISPSELLKVSEKHIVIVTASILNTSVILKKLLFSGKYIENENLFTYHKFISFYLPIFALYAEDKVYINSITIQITNRCNLKCKECSALCSYDKNAYNYEVTDIKKDIDLLFDKIDYIETLVLTGGEPFLHKELFDVLGYIQTNYLNKLNKINIICNGTVLPNLLLSKLMSDMKVEIVISNYTDSIPKIKEKYETFKGRLEENNIKYNELKVDHWVDFGYRKNSINTSSEEKMIDMFDSCNTPCRMFMKGNFIFCGSAYLSQLVLAEEEDENNFFTSDNKKEIIEYMAGYNKDGYLKMCRKCNGWLSINKQYVPVAEQI